MSPADFGAQGVQSPASSPAPQGSDWHSYASQLPKELPDQAYDAIREKYFYQNMAPAVLQAGQPLSVAYDNFKANTQRPQVGSRLGTIATAAGQALTAPISGMNPDPRAQQIQQYINQQAQTQAQGLARQGVSPTPYSLLGQGLGMAPYFAEGMMGPEAAGEAAALRGLPNAGRVMTEAGRSVMSSEGEAALAAFNNSLLKKTTQASAVGLVQGAYDAASNPQDRTGAFIQGAATGTALAAGFEAVGSLGSFLQATHGLDADEAQAVTQTAKGLATPKSEALTTSAVVNGPSDLDKAINTYQLRLKAQQARQGVPWDTKVNTPNGRVRIQMQGADGKTYHLGGAVGLKADDIWRGGYGGQMGTIYDRMAEHLNAGGQVQAINGDPELVNQVLKGLMDINPEAFSTESLLRGEGAVVAPPEMRAAIRSGPSSRFAIDPAYAKANWITPEGDILKVGTAEHEELAPTGDIDDQLEQGWIRTRGNNVEAYGWDNPQLAQAMYAAKADSSHLGHLNVYDRSTREFGDGVKVPFEDFGEFLNNPNKYARTQAKGGGRFAVNSEDIPAYDKFTALPGGQVVDHETGEIFPNSTEWQLAMRQTLNPTPNLTKAGTPSYGIERGQANVPLSLNGRQQVQELGKRIAAKGGLDSLHMADLDRYRQTANGILDNNPLTYPHMPNPGLRSWNHGFEGVEQTPQTTGMINDLVSNPDEAIAGNESFNQFDQRLSSNMDQLTRRHELNPDEKIGVVTSSRDIGLMKAKLAAGQHPAGLGFDPETFKGAHENPGSVYRLAQDENGNYTIRAVDMSSDAPLRGGIYMIRHGETPWNKSAREMQIKERPMATTYTGNTPFVGNGVQGMELDSPTPGGNPSIHLRDTTDKGVVFHEDLHGHFGALQLHNDVRDIMTDSTADQIFHSGFSPVSHALYGSDPDVWREEVYVHGADALRTSNESKIQAFVDADTDHATWYNWMAGKTQQILDRGAQLDDSLHKRWMERRLGSVLSRATGNLEDVRNLYSQADAQLDLQHGGYAITEGGKSTLYDSRDEALQELEKQGEPLNAPELVSGHYLPEGVARYSKQVRPLKYGDMGSKTDPPSPEVAQGEGPKRAEGGWQLASKFFRPFNDWISTVATKNSWPELYHAFEPIDRAQVDYNNTVRPYYKFLQSTMANYGEARQQQFFKWFAADEGARPGIERESNFKPQELADLAAVQEGVLNPLGQEFGLHLGDYLKEMVPQLKNGADNIDKNFMTSRVKMGRLDVDENNFTKLVAKYLEFGAYDQHLKPAIEAAEKVTQEKLEDGSSRAGNLLPLLQRHIDYLRGQPDFTQEIIKGALSDSLHMINKGLAGVNSKLGTDIQPLKEISDDPLGKYALFSYAGALAMKPATIIRDALQIMLTTFPIAGKYTFRGIEKAFGAFDKSKAQELWDVPQRYGALIERNDLRSLYTGTEESGEGVESKMEKIANWGMKSIQFTHNSNRLAAFWGHSEQVGDALDEFRASGDQKRFLRDSGVWFLPQAMREKLLAEIPQLDRSSTPDFTYRAAKELVEASQWNFKRGANPGLYEYQLGRLFGQYGTWPLNYIEYARRFATSGDSTATAHALTRLVLAHGAVLSAGQGMGVDTGRWVFTGPMAYEGGPLFEAVTALPTAASPGQEGSDARRNLLGVIPGFDRVAQAKDIFSDVVSDSPNYWPRLLGFHAAHPGKE